MERIAAGATFLQGVMLSQVWFWQHQLNVLHCWAAAASHQSVQCNCDVHTLYWCVWNSLWSSLKLKPSPCIDLLWPQNVPFGKAGPKTDPIIGVIKMFAITRCPCGVIVSNCNKRGGQLFFIWSSWLMTHVRYLTKSSVCSHWNTSASRFDPGAVVALCANSALIFLWCHKRLHSKLTVNRVSTISGQYLPLQIKHSGDFLVFLEP